MKLMTKAVATVQLEFEVPVGISQAELADCVSATLTENLEMSGYITNWRYLEALALAQEVQT